MTIGIEKGMMMEKGFIIIRKMIRKMIRKISS